MMIVIRVMMMIIMMTISSPTPALSSSSSGVLTKDTKDWGDILQKKQGVLKQKNLFYFFDIYLLQNINPCKGEVTFISLVKRGSNDFWEAATGIRVRVMADQDRTGTVKDETEKDSDSSEDDEDTTRWSSVQISTTTFIDEEYFLNGSSFSPEHLFEPYERLEAEHGGWTRNTAASKDVLKAMSIILVFIIEILD